MAGAGSSPSDCPGLSRCSCCPHTFICLLVSVRFRLGVLPCRSSLTAQTAQAAGQGGTAGSGLSPAQPRGSVNPPQASPFELPGTRDSWKQMKTGNKGEGGMGHKNGLSLQSKEDALWNNQSYLFLLTFRGPWLSLAGQSPLSAAEEGSSKSQCPSPL